MLMRSCLTVYTYRSIVQAMKYKLLIIIAATLLIAWCGYMIYQNAQPRPKKAIELNTEPIKATIPTEQPTEPTPDATEQPRQLPTNTTAPVEQKAVTVAVVQPETTPVVVSQSINYETIEGSNKVTYCDLTYNDSTTQRIKVQTIYSPNVSGRYFCSQWVGTSKTKLVDHQ